MSFFNKAGIVNVKMVITEEKILSNIDKIQKLINPNSKKQIVQLEDDAYFKDLIESVKTYLVEYPRKKAFPANVYKAAYDLVEYATTEFEENTKRIEGLIRKRERNIKLGSVLRDVENAIKGKAKNWKEIIKKMENKYPSDVIDALTIVAENNNPESEDYKDACKLIDTKITNLESNLHIEIDMERIEDRSKALSYIGIEIAEALKYIPAPAEEFIKDEQNEISSQIIESDSTPEETDTDNTPKADAQTSGDSSEDVSDATESEATEETESSDETDAGENTEEGEKEEINEEPVATNAAAFTDEQQKEYIEETRVDYKPSLWQRIKNSKIVKTISYILRIRVVLDYPALPEGNGDK